MNKIIDNYDLTSHTTWRTPIKAKGYINIERNDDIQSLVHSGLLKQYSKYVILGKGANSIFVADFYDGLVIEITTKGKIKVSETDTTEDYKLMAGEDWIETVEYFVNIDRGGIENLALIPGNVGASPIQNIAAYGTSLSDIFVNLEYIDLTSGKLFVLDSRECCFGYRTSIFKDRIRSGDHGFIITSITLRLTKPRNHKIVHSYRSLSEKITDVVDKSQANTVRNTYESIIKLRKTKLPNSLKVGTNGSVFVNPIVTGDMLVEILKKFPKTQYYPGTDMKYFDDGTDPASIDPSRSYKIASAHIFDELGWKGRRIGEVGTWEHHALVLCNYGHASSSEILSVLAMMQDDFEDATGIRLEPEINVIR